MSDSATPWTTDLQALLSMGFFRQKYWSGLLCPPEGDLPTTGIKPRSPTLQAILYRLSHQGSPMLLGLLLVSAGFTKLLFLTITKYVTEPPVKIMTR